MMVYFQCNMMNYVLDGRLANCSWLSMYTTFVRRTLSVSRFDASKVSR